ncbi:MAG: NAD(P)-dependent oxidoreductase [Oscillospiraceae bacterium]
MSDKVLIVSFSFEQEPDAFAELEKGGYTPLLWAQKDRLNATQTDFVNYWNTLSEKPCGIVMGADIAVGEEFLSQATGLEAVSLNCAGYDHLDLQAFAQHGVKVCNVPRQNFSAVADLAFGQIISLMRKIPQGDRSIRAGKWCEGVERGSAVSGKTIGIMGLGAVGQAVAQRAKGFDMDIIVSSTSQKEELAQKYGLKYVDKETFFKTADIIVLCCPANAQTHYVINAETLALMKNSAVIINPSRGGLVDTKALINALNTGAIAGAALDVFETEPMYESELFTTENTVLTPHIGGLADREIRNVALKSAQNIISLLQGAKQQPGIV